MATLTSTKIKNTYDALLKASDNDAIGSSAKQITDGLGNGTPLYISTTQIGIGVTPEATYDLHVYSNAKVGGNLTVTGDLTVEGTTTTIDTQTLTVEDPLIEVASNNTSTDAVDIGWYGKYAPSGTVLYAGLFRDTGDSKFKLFRNLEEQPTTTVNTSGTGYTKADLVIGDLDALDIDAENITLPTTGTNSGIPSSVGVAYFGNTNNRIFNDSSGITLRIQASNNLNIDAENFSFSNTNGSLLRGGDSGVRLYYQNSEKLTTTTNGIEVTGTGSFTGQVTIPETPVADTDAASKGYVDSQVTAQDLDFSGDSGSGSVDLDSQSLSITGGTLITTTALNQNLDIDHDSVSRSDTTSSASPAFGGTFTAVDSVTSSTEGHITAINLKTVTVPTPTYPAVNNNTITINAGSNLDTGGAFTLNQSFDETITIDLATTITGLTSVSSTTFSGQLDGTISSTTTATTQTQGDNSTKVATTAYVDSAIGGQDTLAEVLANGNTTGGTDIAITAGDKITNFTSTGIDDNATSTSLTIASDGVATFINNIDINGNNKHIRFIDTYGNWLIEAGDGANNFKIHSQSLAADYLTLEGGGQLNLGEYGSGSFTGTATYRLAVDSSGDVIEIPIGGGAVDGSGTANTVTMWSDTDTITDAPITVSGNNATFAGMITVNGGGIDIDNNDDVRLRFDNASVFKAGLQVATTSGDMIAGSAVNDFAIRAQENMLFATGGNTERMRIDSSGDSTFYGDVIIENNFPTITLKSTDNTAVAEDIVSSIDFYAGDTSSAGQAINAKISSYATDAFGRLGLQFLTGGNGVPEERMRIDSSGSIKYQTGSGKGYDFGASGSSASVANMFCPSGYTLAFGTNNTERMRITSSGNVGIGVVPESTWYTGGQTRALQIGGTVSIFNLFDTRSVFANNYYLTTDGSDTYINNDEATQYYQEAGAHIWKNAPSGTADTTITWSESMRIDSSGNVNIATGRLRIERGSDEGSQLNLWADSDGFCFIAGYDLEIKTGSNNARSTKVKITPTGSVGIGTDSPDSLLNIEGSRNNAILTIGNSTNDSGWTTGDKLGAINFYSADSSGAGSGVKASLSYEVALGTSSATNAMVFRTAGTTSGTNNTERMRITSGGDVEITGGYSSSQTFQSTGSLRISSNASTGVGNVALELMTDASTTRYLAVFTNSNGIVGNINTNGSATAYVTSSDYRLKENVVEMTDALERVSQLKPSRFNFIADADKTVDGFLAHEVQEIVPEAITGEKDEMRTEEYEETPAVYEEVIHEAQEAIEWTDKPSMDNTKVEIQEWLDDNEIEWQSADTKQELLDRIPEYQQEAQEEWTERVLVSEAVMATREVPVYQGIDQSKLVPLLVDDIQELKAEIESLKQKINN